MCHFGIEISLLANRGAPGFGVVLQGGDDLLVLAPLLLESVGVIARHVLFLPLLIITHVTQGFSFEIFLLRDVIDGGPLQGMVLGGASAPGLGLLVLVGEGVVLQPFGIGALDAVLGLAV